MKRIRLVLSTRSSLILLISSAGLASPAALRAADNAQNGGSEVIQGRAIRAHLEFLADDLLEGRGTGSRGHRLAANYIRAQCETAGLRGGVERGGYFQKVPLVRTIVDERQTTLAFKSGNSTTNLVYAKDFAVLDTHREVEGGAEAGMVFVGYGVTAPKQGYDDYATVDAKGKIVVLLAAESPPSFPAAVRAYYTDHDVKRANAVVHGAIGMLYIDSPAVQKRLPWAFMLREFRVGWNSMRWLEHPGAPGGLDDPLKLCAALSPSGAEALFADESCSLKEIFMASEKGTPPRFALSKSAALRFHTRHQRIESENVVARLEGSDPQLRAEHVLISTHLDHLGIGDPVDGDTIYNGAMDNAGGCAVLLEVARAFASSKRPKRSLLFLFVTGEEAGLLGSEYFANHPTIPIRQLIVNINFDGGTVLTPVSDVIAWGVEHSSLQTHVQRAANQTAFTVTHDPFPEEGFFVRSDQFSFVKKGVPSVFVALGIKSTDPRIDALALLKKWLVTTYHSPKDDVSQPIQYETSAQFARFVFALSRMVAMDSLRPRWNDKDFFGELVASQRESRNR